MPRKVLDQRSVSIAEVKTVLKKRNEAELDQFQKRTLDYATKFSKINGEEAPKLVEKLMADFSVSRSEAVQLANCMPSSIEECRTFLQYGKRKLITTRELEELLKVLNEYREA